jgi:hypothetical protein
MDPDAPDTTSQCGLLDVRIAQQGVTRTTKL